MFKNNFINFLKLFFSLAA